MKKIRAIMILSVLIAVVAGLMCGCMSPPGKNKMEKYFKRDQEDIFLITDYLVNSTYSEIFINGFNPENAMMFTGIESRYVKVDDDAVVEAINRLFKEQGYSVIDKTGNTIYFQKWIRSADFGSGIAYSINGEDEPVLQFLTKIESLSEDDWYYYEADYNEWRIRSTTDGGG